MILYILLILVQIETALSQKSERNEHICVNEEYTYHLHAYPCAVGFGEFSGSGSHAEQLQEHFNHGIGLNMTPSIPLIRVACAVGNGVNIPQKCGFMYHTTDYKHRETRMVEVIKSKLKEANGNQKGTIYFFFGCYTHGIKVTCAAKIEPWKGNKKQKCTPQKLNRKDHPEAKQRRVSASTARRDPPPPASPKGKEVRVSPDGDLPPPSREEEEVRVSPDGDSPSPGLHESGPGPATRDGEASRGLSTSSEDP